MDTNVTNNLGKKPYKRRLIISFICFITGIVFWIPNLVFQFGCSFWLLTFIINPIGAIFGYLGKSKFGLVSNILMTFSFFIIMFLGYLLGAIFGWQ